MTAVAPPTCHRSRHQRSRHPLRNALLALTPIALLLIVVLGVVAQNPWVKPVDLPAIWALPIDDHLRIAVYEIRFPRVVLGLLAGAALGVAGALMQDSLRNPLAAPELLGVSSGCALVVALVAIIGLPVPRPLVPAAAALGGLAVGAVVLAVGLRLGGTVSLILAGLSCSTFLSGCVVAVLTLAKPSDAGLFYSYLLGSLANRGWDAVALVAPWVLLGIPAALACAPALNAVRLGDDVAAGLGVRVPLVRRMIFVVCCLLTAAIVAVSGPIGFVALVAPHLSRRLLGTADARWVLPGSVLAGALLLAGADLGGRLLAEPREIAAGVVTVLFGGPVLLALLRSRAERGAA